MKASSKIFKLLAGFMLALFLGTAIAPLVNQASQAEAVNPWVVGTTIWLVQLVTVSLPAGVFLEGLTITDTEYAGEVLDRFIAYASTMFDTLLKGCINVEAGIKKSVTVPKLTVSDFIQAHQETPTHGGSVDVDGRKLVPEDFMGYLQFNPRKFESHWKAVQMNPKLLDAALPKSAESAIIQEVLKLNGAYMDKAVWRAVKDAAAIATAKANGLGPGDNNLIFNDGFQKKMYEDDDVTKIGSPVALTDANIVSKFEAVAAGFSTEVYDRPNFKFMLAGANRENYKNAQKAQATKGVDFTQAGSMTFDGKPVVIINGMSPNTIVGGEASRGVDSNFWMGVNDTDEETYLHLKRLQANSELWFIKMLFKMDVNYGLSEEIVAYMTETYD